MATPAKFEGFDVPIWNYYYYHVIRLVDEYTYEVLGDFGENEDAAREYCANLRALDKKARVYVQQEHLISRLL